MRFLLFCCLLAFLTPLQAANDVRALKVMAKDSLTQQTGEVVLYGKSFAVIIGIDQYKFLPADRQLKFAVKDAQGVAESIKKHYKFDKIFSLYNQEATRERILDLLTEELAGQMSENDALFVFWAGHGNQESSRTGEIGYLIPYDGDPKKLRTNITMTEIRDTVSKKLPAKHVFYIMDACYSGLLTETRSIDKVPRRDLAYLQEVTKEMVRQVLTAGSKGQEVLDGGPNGHSVFTGRLIEVLEKAGDFITANEIQAILKEKVYGDARARNHTQTPAYGTLYGSGDFVFIPSLEQKVADNKSEIARLEAELAALDLAATQAKLAASSAEQERLQREAESARRAAVGKLKAEQLKQQQLASEDSRRQAAAEERQRLLVAKSEDEKKLAELKAAAEARRKSVGPVVSATFPTLESVIAEIKRLNGRINNIEAGYAQQLAQTRLQVKKRYDNQFVVLEREKKDEFESVDVFKARQEKQRVELVRQRDEEMNRLNAKTLAANEIAPLRAQIASLSEKEYVLGADSVMLELGAYNADRQEFAISIKNKSNPKGKGGKIQGGGPLLLASSGVISLNPANARTFKQHYTAGLVRSELRVRADGEVLEVAVLNDADQSRRAAVGGLFLTDQEHREKEEVQERAWDNVRPWMLPIPAGHFQMGSNDGDGDEKPAHTVQIAAFQLAKTEVTQAHWRALMGDNPSQHSDCDSCPVDNVNWNDVQIYLQKLNVKTGKKYRLPSEAEWEYACRVGGQYNYCGSNNVDAIAWHDGNSDAKTHPVAQKQPNAFGLYDMSGNVWEWVQDCWNGNYINAPSDGSAINTGDCGQRVLRGSSWDLNALNSRATLRFLDGVEKRTKSYGFRIALSLPFFKARSP